MIRRDYQNFSKRRGEEVKTPAATKVVSIKESIVEYNIDSRTKQLLLQQELETLSLIYYISHCENGCKVDL